MLNSVWYAKKMGRRIMGTLRRTKRLHRRLLAAAELPVCRLSLQSSQQLRCDTCVACGSGEIHLHNSSIMFQMCGTPAVAHAFPGVA